MGDAPEQTKGRARGPLIKRWIGITQRRADRRRLKPVGEGAQVIALTWEQTFGRPTATTDTDRGADESPAIVLRLRPCA
jgi:hypothetical protein